MPDDLGVVDHVSFGPKQKGEPNPMGQAKMTIGGNTFEAMQLSQIQEQLSRIELMLQQNKIAIENLEHTIKHRW